MGTKILENGRFRDMTVEGLAARRREINKAATEERTRPLTASEVSTMLITQQINTLSVDDNTALRMLEFYPEWAVGVVYTEESGCKIGHKVRHNGRLYKLRQFHTAQPGWEPSTDTASLWEQINETHAGTIDDPIPYEGNMALEQGKHYMQDWIIYRCTRDTIDPVYHALRDLVGHYVEVI